MDNIVSVLLGGALVAAVLTFLQFLITRRDAKAEKDSKILKAIEALTDKITGLEKRMDREAADEARRNILLFDDELRRGDQHSEESFRQILTDCDDYTKYCIANKETYKNNRAESAIENIRTTYQIVKHEDRFI